MANETRKASAHLRDPEVLAIVERFTAIMLDGERDREAGVARSMVALILTCTSACKSYGIHPVEFIRNFELVYASTVAADVPPAPIGGVA